MPSVDLYDDLITDLPEFTEFDVFGRDFYEETGMFPLGQVGLWLNALVEGKAADDLLIRITGFLNRVYYESERYRRDIVNDFCVYLFWTLNHRTIERVKSMLLPEIVDEGRKYLQVVDGPYYQAF